MATAVGRLCPKWARGSECTHNGCPFRHVALTDIECRRVERATASRLAALAENSDTDDPHASKGTHGGRFLEFADWLVNTFGGSDVLNMGSGVIDVAGGRGSLSFELACKRAIRCTLLEPREVWLKSNQRRHLRKHPSIGCYRHVRARLDGDFERSDIGAELLRDCSLAVGLHSDEATEPLVEMALRRNLPFAVVPCCVFPGSFPMRRLQSGGSVRSYDDFCRWLLERAPGIESAFLPFAGRNRVIYRRRAHAHVTALSAAPLCGLCEEDSDRGPAQQMIVRVRPVRKAQTGKLGVALELRWLRDAAAL